MRPTSPISVREFSHLGYFLPNLRLSTPIGLGMFICTYIYMNVWIYTSEVTAKRIRERYLRAILRQDIAFFDKVGAGEVTTRIQTDTRAWFCPFLSHRGTNSIHPRFGPTRYI